MDWGKDILGGKDKIKDSLIVGKKKLGAYEDPQAVLLDSCWR